MKRAVVIGGSGGVGAAICAALARDGYDVALTWRSNRYAAEATAGEVRKLGRKATALRLDTSDADAVSALFEELAGPIHAVVHAAGPLVPQSYTGAVTPAEFRRVVDADLHGFFAVVHAALPRLRATGGALVALSTAGLRRHPPGDVLSTAPKAAVEALIRAVAREEGRFGVRANAVALGVIETGMFHELVESEELTPEWRAAALKNTPMRRFGSADEVGDAVVFLAGPRSSYITGQVLNLDGGYGI